MGARGFAGDAVAARRLVGSEETEVGHEAGHRPRLATAEIKQYQSPSPWVILAGFENRHAAEHTVALLGHNFRHKALNGTGRVRRHLATRRFLQTRPSR